jgi:prepilin-type N-terminal cleavage/methylation domain-containing protein
MPTCKAGTSSSRRCGVRDGRGFTLFELLVVLMLLSLVMAVVLPSLGRSGEKLRSEARSLASILRNLEDSAATRKQTFSVTFELPGGRVSWEEPEGTRSEEFPGLSAVELQSRGMVKDGTLVVYFPPSGPAEYMNVYVTEGDKELVVSVNPISRRVKVHEAAEQ